MKIIFKAALAGLIIFAAHGCKEEDKEIGTPFSKMEGLTSSTWIIAETYLVDEGNPSKPERNLSSIFEGAGNPLEINFEQNGSFTVTPGGGLNPFPIAGTWSFDDSDAPTRINLMSPAGELLIAALGGPTRITDTQLKLNLVKRTCDSNGEAKPALGYRLVFNRKPI